MKVFLPRISSWSHFSPSFQFSLPKPSKNCLNLFQTVKLLISALHLLDSWSFISYPSFMGPQRQLAYQSKHPHPAFGGQVVGNGAPMLVMIRSWEWRPTHLLHWWRRGLPVRLLHAGGGLTLDISIERALPSINGFMLQATMAFIPWERGISLILLKSFIVPWLRGRWLGSDSPRHSHSHF